MAEETKRSWISQLVPGRTFADIGGLGGSSINEMVTLAIESGAAEATMVDVLPFSDPLWRDFERKCTERGVTGYRRLQADLVNPGEIGPWDVVHSSGILYHTPDPVRMTIQLRALCREYLIFTSMIVPELIENSAGRLDLSGGRAVFVPAIDAAARRICATHLDSAAIRVEGINMTDDVTWLTPDGPVNYGPWWWLFPAAYVERLLKLVGFKILIREETIPGRAISFLCLK